MRRQRPEDIEQNGIIAFTKGTGGRHNTLGVRRRAGDYQGTMQTEGTPDLWLFLPAVVTSARYHLQAKPPIGVWWEAKAPEKKRTPEQVEFGDWCEKSGTPYGWGTLNDFYAWLIQHGRLSPDQIAHYRRPPVDEATPQ